MANKTAYFNRFSIEMPEEAANDCSHSGPCDDDVAHWAPKITRPAECTPDALRAELKEYGSWDAEELSDDDANWERIVWLAAGNIKDMSYHDEPHWEKAEDAGLDAAYEARTELQD